MCERSKLLLAWLAAIGPFSLKTPDQKMYETVLRDTDAFALPHIISKFGGIEAIEIACFGAPIAVLHNHGYAPGSYYGHCATCAQQFTADKRAQSCLPCAVNYAKRNTSEASA